MDTGLLHLHSFLRWIALIAIVVMLFRSYTGLVKGRKFSAADNRWSLITLITFHLQVVIGFVLYFMNGWYAQMDQMSNLIVRFFAAEHMVGMLAATILITIGRARAKRTQTQTLKFKTHLWFFLVAFVLVMISIPWPFLEVGAGRSWFPGM
jgi:hypothetical protein